MEEYLLVPRLKRIGPIEQLPDRVVTSCRRYQQEGVVRLALKKSALIALYYAGVPPARLARWYW